MASVYSSSREMVEPFFHVTNSILRMGGASVVSNFSRSLEFYKLSKQSCGQYMYYLWG